MHRSQNPHEEKNKNTNRRKYVLQRKGGETLALRKYIRVG